MPDRRASTLDLFTDWTPPDVVERYDPVVTRAASLRTLVSHAIGQTLKDATKRGLTRSEVATRMSDLLGEDISEATLDAYASEAKEAHNLTVYRWIALMQVTQDARLAQFAAESLGKAVVDEAHLPLIELALLQEHEDELAKRKKALQHRIRKGGR